MRFRCDWVQPNHQQLLHHERPLHQKLPDKVRETLLPPSHQALFIRESAVYIVQRRLLSYVDGACGACGISNAYGCDFKLLYGGSKHFFFF